MNADSEVRVHAVVEPSKLMPAFLLFSWPSMLIHEDATRWLAKLAFSTGTTHQRNVAYSLSHWHTYCLAAGIDYRRATVDDLVGYKTAMLSIISDSTGEPLAAGTIGQRINAVANYYASGEKAGWNQTAIDLRHALLGLERSGKGREESHAVPIEASAKALAPKAQRTETDIRPLSPDELRAVLDALGPSPEQLLQGDRRPLRDRLIAEWLSYVGLRLSEAVSAASNSGLATHHILHLTPDPTQEFDHAVVRVFGKGRKFRNVAVPNWLVQKTIEYVEGERELAVKAMARRSPKLFVAGLRSGKSHTGKPITGRSFEKAFAIACRRAGITRLVEKRLQDSDQCRLIEVARHSPHDLRHTYAIMRYFAEREIGNVEPWKPIQAQLGHMHMQTTIDTYLGYVSIHSQWALDLRRVSVRELAGLPRG